MAFVTLAMLTVVLVATILSCVSDVRALRIPNAYALAVLLSFIPAWLATPAAFGPWWHPPLAVVIVFMVTYLMFIKSMMGGGDAKLGTALAPWLGLKGLLPFLFYMALMGGLLGIVSLALHKFKPFRNAVAGGWIEQAQTGGNAIPYGIAITFGAWAAIFHTGLLHNQLNEVFKIIH